MGGCEAVTSGTVRPGDCGIVFDMVDAEEHFARLDELRRELQKEEGIHLVDIGTTDLDADEDAVEVTVDVRGVRVTAWFDEDRDLKVFSYDEGFEDEDDIHDHLNAGDHSEDFVCALLDEVEWLWRHHGDTGLSDYRDHRARSRP